MSIIGINGKINSGKDTIGSIIQYIVCLHKNTLAEHQKDFAYFQEAPVSNSLQSGWEIKKFAGKLKQIASLLTGIPVEKFEDQEFKKSYLGSEWGTVESNPLNAIPVFGDVHFNELMSIREFLQKLGTDAVRNGLHENAWVNALFSDYKSKRELLQADGTWIESDTGEVDFAVSIKYPNWIITDMRFPNEMEAVKERKGITIRVLRITKEQSLKLAAVRSGKLNATKEDIFNVHPSETALDNDKFDYEIINDGSIEDLIEKVKQILITEKII